MVTTTSATPSLLSQVFDYANRADPYPLYAEMRKTPVARQDDGTYVVSTYAEIVQLLHDPRISSNLHNLKEPPPDVFETSGLPPTFIRVDPPDHDRLRRLAMRHFGPPHAPERIDRLVPDLHKVVTGLIDGLVGRTEVDIVDDFAYPFPVTVICELLGVPREDEPRFHEWVEALVQGLDPVSGDPAEVQSKRTEALKQMGLYFAGLVDSHRRSPGDDMLSGLATDDGPEGRLTDEQLLTTAVLLLVAGHETTVNLITNGTLTLLRHPEVLERLRHEPDLAVPMIEELLRYEPPVHIIPWRAALDDVEVGGTVIPKGSRIMLMFASGSRDPKHVRDPDRFDPDRFNPDRFGLARDADQHLGFGGGIHYCFGAPLARLETQIALRQLARRLVNPRLVVDPPPYRNNAVLRGPRHLRVAIEGISPGD
jgi:cytochrome P450